MSRKRKIEAVGAHIASAALGDVVSRRIGAVIGRLEEPPDVDGEVERLDTLVVMVRSAVEAAEGVHVRSGSLRRWLWKLRDAGCEGAAAVRSFRRRAAEEGSRRGYVADGWWGRLLRSAKSLFFPRHSGGEATQLRRQVCRLQDLAAGIGDFLNLLDREITRVEAPPLGQAAYEPGMVEDPDDCGHWDNCERGESSGSLVSSQPDLADSSEYVRWDVPSRDSTDSVSESGSSAAGRGSNELDRCISGVMVWLEAGANMILLAFEAGTQMLRLLDDCRTAGHCLSTSTSTSSSMNMSMSSTSS